MKQTTLFTTLLAIGLAASSFSASAVSLTNNFALGTLTNTTVGLSNSFNITGDIFVDNWNFTISPAETTAAIAVDIDNLPAFEIGSFGAKLIGPSNTWSGVAVGNTFQISPMLLAAGNYDFQIFGTVAGTQGAAYGGTISAFVVEPPVPEPETYAMLLAGLGIVGMISRRRNKQD